MDIFYNLRKSELMALQLVENEELIGTLIETNERVIASLQMYDKVNYFCFEIYLFHANVCAFSCFSF